MSRIRAIVTAVLLVLWMPATSHCALEAAGMIEQSAGCATADGCEGDGCRVIEEGFFKQSSMTAKVPAPNLTACVCFLCLQLVAPITLVSVADFSLGLPAEPQDWIVCWTFEQRSALPANAPDFVA